MRKKQLFKSLLFVLFLSLMSFMLVGCGDDDVTPIDPVPNPTPDVDWDSKVISNVELDDASFSAIYDVDDFDVSLLKLLVSYDDGTSRLMDVTADMFDDSDYKKFKSAGTKKVTVYYNEYEFETKVNIVDYAVYDENLNLNKQYQCVVKVIRNQKTGKLDFIIDPQTGFAGCQMQFVFEKGKIELSNFVIANTDKTYGNFIFDSNNATLTITFVSVENITEVDTTLFSCDFTGDFRWSGLKINNDFNNKIYTFTEDGSSEVMATALYHVSQK